MLNLFQLRAKNDKRLKKIDAPSRELIKSMVSYMSQYELKRYDIEIIKFDLIEKASKLKNSKLFINEVQEPKEFCNSILEKRNLNQISIRNLFMIEFIPMIGFFFSTVLLILHLLSVSVNETTTLLNVEMSFGYPLFILFQYFSIVHMFYLDRRYALDNKTKKNIGTFANIFLILTIIQYIMDNPFLSDTIFTFNLVILILITFLFLSWTIYNEIQKN